LGWPLVVLGLFCVLPPRRAVIAAFIGGWLMLPMAGITLSGFPNYTKTTATVIGALLGVALFDAQRLSQLRLRWLDAPMIVWCLWPLPSAMAAGLGAYAGVSAVFQQTLAWGIPYLLGRAYFTDLAACKDLALGIFIGGLLYVPLCLYEIRMSPQLHRMIYGFHQHSFAQTKRFGGWRPTVFMQHGLAVGAWMTMASLAGLWLWRVAKVQRLWQIPMWTLSLALVVTTVLVKSTGAWAMLAVGLAMLPLVRGRLFRPALVVLAVAVPVYMAARVTGMLPAARVIAMAEMVAPSERIGSLEYRLSQEDILNEQSMRRPVFGSGPWGDFRSDDQGNSLVGATDGLWMIVLGKYGVTGLAALTAAMLLPAIMLVRRLTTGALSTPTAAPLAVLAVILALVMHDNLLNAMLSPIYPLIAGGLTQVVGTLPQPSGFLPAQVRAAQSVRAARMPARVEAWRIDE
jgi:hypothetical protein